MALGEPEKLPRDPDARYAGRGAARIAPREEKSQRQYGDDGRDLNKEDELLQIVKVINSGIGSTDLGRARGDWAKSYRAFNSKHIATSKYELPSMQKRTRNFVPKTRGAVKKNEIAGAAALFGASDAVTITAENDADPAQQASAVINQEWLNYRLDRSNFKAGMQWFPICMGQLQTSRICGVCFSKQYWEYEFKMIEADPEWLAQNPDHPDIIVDMQGKVMREKIIRDRPRIRAFPPEQAIIDLSAPWEDIVQEGEYFIMTMPMRISQIRVMQKKGRQALGGGPWLELDEGMLKKAAEEYSATGTRTARGRGADPQASTNQPKVGNLDIVWVHENFVRCDGEDYHFYTLGPDVLLSVPGLTEDHYPAHQGERPYVMGLGEIEAFSPLPMSMVQAIAPIQSEINDIRNLAIDTLKQGIAGLLVYKRGTDIDMRAVKERGPDTAIGVSNMDDIRFEKPPGPDPQSYTMHDRLTIELDEMAGSFSQSSVTNNRNANETLGGMRMINNAANGQQEYDIRVFSETYVERVLRQMIMLGQTYESDEHILALVGEKANAYQRFGIDTPTDDLLRAQVTLRVNAGVGSTDPMMKLQKLGGALKMAGETLQFVKGQVMPNAEELFGEIFAAAGYKAERFFKFTSPEEAAQNAQPEPEVMKAQAEVQKVQIEGQRAELENRRFEEESEERKARFFMDVNNGEQQQGNVDRDFERTREVQDRDFGRQREVEDRSFNEERFVGDRQYRRDGEISDRDFGFQRQTGDRDFDMREREFGEKEAAGKNSRAVAVAGHNRAMLEPQPMMDGGPDDPMNAMTTAFSRFEQVIMALAQGQQQTQAFMQQLAQGQAENAGLLRELIAYQRAPKSVIYGPDGRVSGVSVGGEERPVQRGEGGRIEGV